MFEAVLFDFDGVIADTETSNSRFFCRALAQFGVELTEAERFAMIGTNDRELIESYVRRCNPPISFEDFMKVRRGLGNTYEHTDIRPEPGIIDLLRALRARGMRTAVVSSTQTRLIVTALNRMGMTGLFDAIVCGDMTEKHKPDPEPYTKCMALLGVAPRDCVIVEDSSIGIAAGKASGATVVAYQGTDDRQDVSQADRVIRHFADWTVC